MRRKLAVVARSKYLPKVTNRQEEDVLQAQATQMQDYEADGKNRSEVKSNAAEELEVAKWMVERAKGEGLTVKAVAEREKAERKKLRDDEKKSEKLMKELGNEALANGGD